MSDKPHYIGHRKRLRARFLKTGSESLHDYELIELLLFGAIPRGDVKPLAKRLITTFGSFAEVISADARTLGLEDGLGEAAVCALKIAQAGAIRLAQEQVMNKPVLSSWQMLLDYCRASMAYHGVEQFRLLYLNRKNVLIADELQQRGTIDHTPVYPREVIKRALELEASALIMVHNHPSGDTSPSPADIDMTKRIKSIARPLNIEIHDHVIVSRKGYYSFKSTGLL
ncbi:DNA repair protein RadC [Terasakiella brassicae]|uniref:DNA repair protein RadC n=1 Tax=Terasakiella brassicae TaxID=1634917 RepID=A0A917F8Z4_9PROT|nr:DNA repair protein RadC [Terasakiella brassicae]GGF61118.1 DNA repair protein RadC [Terasakiella brassicae]